LNSTQYADKRHAREGLRRDAVLSADGLKIVRVWNNDVDKNLEGVFERILHELKAE
jgi:very-short-patch-repair endonuclease